MISSNVLIVTLIRTHSPLNNPDSKLELTHTIEIDVVDQNGQRISLCEYCLLKFLQGELD